MCVLDKLEPNLEVIALVPVAFAKRNQVVPLSLQDDVLFCAMREDSDLVALVMQLAVLSGYEIQPVLATPEAIDAGLQLLELPQ